jgi:hypothetical protein
MTEKEFKDSIAKGQYNIFVFTSPAMLYACFARHPRVVLVDDQGNIDRFEVKRRETKQQIGYSHFYHNRSQPREWLGRIHDEKEPKAPSTLIWHLQGDKDSEAKRIYDTIRENIDIYPYKDTYKLYPGPNSNTFVQRLLDKVPERKISLPWNCLGKNYR